MTNGTAFSNILFQLGKEDYPEGRHQFLKFPAFQPRFPDFGINGQHLKNLCQLKIEILQNKQSFLKGSLNSTALFLVGNCTLPLPSSHQVQHFYQINKLNVTVVSSPTCQSSFWDFSKLCNITIIIKTNKHTNSLLCSDVLQTYVFCI